MVDYDFKINKEVDFWAATCQIERSMEIAPLGLSKGGDILTIHFDKELDKTNTETLNNLVKSSEFGEYPKDAKKIYMGNIWTLRDTLETSLGKTVLAVDFFELQEDGSTSTVIYLSGEDLTTAEKTDLKSSVASLVSVETK